MARAGPGSAFRQLQGLFGSGSVVAQEDRQLLARFAAERDERAFEALIERHGSMVLTTCRAVLKNEHDSEDAFQATFLVLARKARSIRGADALGGWLHRVAYRTSVQASVQAARRRRVEAEAQALTAPLARNSETSRELQSLVHEEIDRLPESHRLPIVLCDLEGLTYEQAAAQLGWTVPTVRNRLARGRQKLKTRLNRRGATVPALAGLTALPPSLVKTALAASTGGTASTAAALLARTLLKGMLMTKLKIAATIALAAICVISAGLVAAGSGEKRNEPKPAPKPEARAEIVVPQARKPGEPIEFRGIVLAPDGKPVAGARVWASVASGTPETISGPDGRFLIAIPRRDPSRRHGEDYYSILASAPGFGLGWARAPLEPKPSDESKIQLVAEGPPIEGRIVDVEGRPVVDALVQFKSVWVADGWSFSVWTEKLRASEVQSPAEGLLGFKTPIEVRTDADGRFRMAGVGGERTVTLVISGPKIATTEIEVLSYDGPEIRTTPDVPRNVVRLAPPRTTIFYAPKFEAVAAPGRPIEGVVRDKDTGRPIAGLKVEAGVWEKRSSGPDRVLEATTDAQGRYRVTGLGLSQSYWIFAAPVPGQPYIRAKMGLDEAPKTREPIEFDITLKRAVIVRGRVTDRATGLPVLGFVDPFTLAENPFVDEFPGIADSRPGIAWTDSEGRFEIVMPPGRGLIAFLSNQDQYLAGFGAEKIRGYDPKQGRISTRGRVCSVRLYHAVAEVNLEPKADSATVDLQVDPGRTLELRAVDPEGQPIDGLKVEGSSARTENFAIPEPGPTLKIVALDPSRPRRVTISHHGRKLVGSIWLKGNEVGPLTVRLAPWGVVTGQFLDVEKKGLGPWKIFPSSIAEGAKAEESGVLPGSMYSPWVMTDREGRFRIEGLVPGLKYSGQVDSFASPEFKDVVVNPGEVKDLGEIKASWRKPR